MQARTARVLAPVLRDVAACAGLEVRVAADDRRYPGDGPPSDQELVTIWTPDGSGTGTCIREDVTDAELQASVSELVHEAVVEGRWSAGLSTSWPPCPWHPDTHPLEVELRTGEVVWSCPADDKVVCRVGDLAQGRAEPDA